MKRLLTLTLVLLMGVCTVGVSRSASAQRLTIQGRIDALNLFVGDSVLFIDDSLAALGLSGPFSPIVNLGVRVMDGDRLYLGLGLGFTGFSATNCDDPDADCPTETTVSRSAFTLSPTAAFDLISRPNEAFYLITWFNFGSFGSSETEVQTAGGTTTVSPEDGIFIWGANLGMGIRGKFSDAFGAGAEFGWGFLSFDEDDMDTLFAHGLFGTITIEASLGL